ncbi:MAG: 4Fe-4S binding protein [Candidatus Hadarchaeales archaeon]
MRRKVLLRCGGERAGSLLAELVRETGLLPHLLRADLTARGSEVLISLEEDEVEVLRGSPFLREKGVELREVRRRIGLKRESCTDCGACVSLCPTGALRLGEDYSLRLEEEKCVYCGLCLTACPVRALEMVES